MSTRMYDPRFAPKTSTPKTASAPSPEEYRAMFGSIGEMIDFESRILSSGVEIPWAAQVDYEHGKGGEWRCFAVAQM